MIYDIYLHNTEDSKSVKCLLSHMDDSWYQMILHCGMIFSIKASLHIMYIIMYHVSCLRMADRALLAGYPQYIDIYCHPFLLFHV